MHLRTVFVFIALFQFSLAIQIPAGHTYTYDYVTQVTFNEPDVTSGSQARKDVGLKLTCKVAIEPVFARGNKMLVKLTVKSARLDGAARPDHSTDVKTLTRHIALAQLEGSEVRQVYSPEKDPAWSVNLKKGIFTLLQLQRQAATKTEVDASGECQVTYKVDGLRITEKKTGCKPVSTVGQFSNIRDILGVDVTSSSETKYVLSSDDVIQSVTSEEVHVSRVNMRDNLAARVSSTQSLTLEKKELGAQAVQASTVEEAAQVINAKNRLKLQGSTLATKQEGQPCDVKNCDKCLLKLLSLVEDLRPSLQADQTATVEGGEAFLTLVTALRNAGQEAITKMLQDEKNEEIRPVLLEAVTAAQTPAGQAAIMGYLDFDEEYDFRLQERYLLAAAFSTHPTDSLVRDLFELYKRNVKSTTLRESIGDALGAVMYSYCQIGDQCKDTVIEEAKKLILDRVENCAEDGCRPQHLRVLGNAGVAEALPLLIKYAEQGADTPICSAAIKALRRLDDGLFTEEVKTVMRKIYHQYRKAYDSAVRTQALMVLLTHAPSDDDVREVVESTTDPDQTEHSMYVQQRLFQMANRDHEFKLKVEKALNNITLRNYHILAPKGKALAFKESLAETRGLKATYDMYVQNSKAGIMKRSGMDVDLISPSSTMPLYSFGIFAAGLEGLLGEEVEVGQENADPTAGLALDLLGVALRPVTFFTGQSGLMSAVWNAPSELTNALQANLLLQDHSQTIGLQNGLTVNLNVQGTVSMDLSGMVSISLWNKNCVSLIKNTGSMVLQGSMGIHTGAFRAGTTFSANSRSVMDFKTDVDFYDKIKMCLQMGRDAVTFRHNVTKYEKANGFKTAYRATIRRRGVSGGVSYPLPKPNNEQCRVLLAGQS